MGSGKFGKRDVGTAERFVAGLGHRAAVVGWFEERAWSPFGGKRYAESQCLVGEDLGCEVPIDRTCEELLAKSPAWHREVRHRGESTP